MVTKIIDPSCIRKGLKKRLNVTQAQKLVSKCAKGKKVSGLRKRIKLTKELRKDLLDNKFSDEEIMKKYNITKGKVKKLFIKSVKIEVGKGRESLLRGNF